MSGISPVISAAIKIQAMFRGQQSRNQQLRNKQLFEAAESGDISEVKNLLARGADVNAKGRYGWTALHWAADNGFAEIVKLLLKAGAKTDVIYSLGDTLLHFAAYDGNLNIVELLLDSGADINVTDRFGFTALHWEADKGCEDIVQALVIAGADLTDNDGLTALDFVFPRNYSNIENAIEAGKNELIKLHQDKLNKYQKKQDQLPGYIKFVLKQSLKGTSAVTRTIVQFIEKPLSKKQIDQVNKYIEERASVTIQKERASVTIQTAYRGYLERKK